MQEINAGSIDKNEFEKISKFLNSVTSIGTLQAENFTLTYDDVKELHNKYLSLEKDIKGTEKQVGTVYVNSMESYLISALKHEATEISKIRKFEDDNNDKKLEAKKAEETPRYNHPWYRLFRATPNRAQELVNDEAALNADYKHNIKDAENSRLEKELEQIEVGAAANENLPLRKRRKLRNKIKKHEKAMKRLKKKLGAAEPKPGEPGNVQNADPSTAPKTMHEPENKGKPKSRTKKPVFVIEQLPGQMDIENINAPQ